MINSAQNIVEEIPSTLHGFTEIRRYWDKQSQMCMARILPGEYYVTKNNEKITTILGSCISACIRDPIAHIGGMNHFMLPLTSSGITTADDEMAARFGNVAMEYLINAILKNGGRKKNLEVKLFGGGKVLSNMNDIGKQNIYFAREFVKIESLKLVSEDLGDIYPRRVNYEPMTGRVMVKKLTTTQGSKVLVQEMKYKADLISQPLSGEIDLF